MTTLKLPAFILAGLFLTTGASAASAATIAYDLTGRASGTYDVLSDPGATPIVFDDVGFDLDLFGDLPGTDLGATDVIHLDSGELTIGGHTADFTFGPHAVAVFDPLDGTAAFGRRYPSLFHPIAVFGGPALDGYDWMSGFPKRHVWVNFKHPFDVMFGDAKVRLDITDFDRGRFSATVPEPASWALMLIGFGGAGTVLRRRRALSA